MKNKKGFTLIELLAVIIILAVIALIATPIVLNVIESARKNANKNSVYGLIDGAKLYYIESAFDTEKQAKFDGITNILPDIKNSLSGKAPESGSLYINEEGNIGIAVVYDNKCYVKDFKESEVTESDNISSCTLTTQIASSYVIFGGKYLDYFEKVIETKDGGYLAIGSSNSKKVLNIENKSNNINYDGIIVKVDKNGYIEWYNTYGYEGHDYFRNVLEIDDGYIVLAKVNDISSVGDYQKIHALKYDINGNLVDDKVLLEKHEMDVSNIIKKDNNYYVIGMGRNIIDEGAYIIYVAKYSLDFEKQYLKTYSDGYGNRAYDAIINSSGNIVLVGNSAGVGGIFEGIDKSEMGVFDGLILEIKPETGDIVSKAILPIESNFYKVAETDDSYIVSGCEYDDNSEALIAKYSKTPNENGILPLIYKKTLEGSKNDYFKSLTVKDNKIITVGYTYSYDGNFNRLNDNAIETGIISEFDMSGNLLNIKKIGGSSGEELLDIISIENGYIVVGQTFSKDGDIEGYTYGNSDAFLMKLNNNYVPVKEFNTQIILSDENKQIVKNYGAVIPTVENRENLKLYTTNDPSKDLGSWCTSNSSLDSNSNYRYVDCLQPFNKSDILSYSKLISTINDYDVTVSKSLNWISFYFDIFDAGSIDIKNFKLKFEGTDYVTINEAVNLKYIEPLVLYGALRADESHFFPSSNNILNGGDLGIGRYPKLYIKIKQKKSITNVYFETNRENIPSSQASFYIEEYKNFDISIEQAR